jgi:hypothetical protein
METSSKLPGASSLFCSLLFLDVETSAGCSEVTEAQLSQLRNGLKGASVAEIDLDPRARTVEAVLFPCGRPNHGHPGMADVLKKYSGL